MLIYIVVSKFGSLFLRYNTPYKSIRGIIVINRSLLIPISNSSSHLIACQFILKSGLSTPSHYLSWTSNACRHIFRVLRFNIYIFVLTNSKIVLGSSTIELGCVHVIKDLIESIILIQNELLQKLGRGLT